MHKGWQAVRASQLASQPKLVNKAKIEPKTVQGDRKSTRLNSSHSQISYAVFCLKKKKKIIQQIHTKETINTDQSNANLSISGSHHHVRRPSVSKVSHLARVISTNYVARCSQCT